MAAPASSSRLAPAGSPAGDPTRAGSAKTSAWATRVGHPRAVRGMRRPPTSFICASISRMLCVET
ncbi:MAG: hypothetical protein FJ276_03135 [Planctomycetes bacterium]|nr:hypothetical protein [Planctomycetota bacterium]